MSSFRPRYSQDADKVKFGIRPSERLPAHLSGEAHLWKTRSPGIWGCSRRLCWFDPETDRSRFVKSTWSARQERPGLPQAPARFQNNGVYRSERPLPRGRRVESDEKTAADFYVSGGYQKLNPSLGGEDSAEEFDAKHPADHLVLPIRW